MTVMGAASLSASEFTRMRCPSGDTSYPLPCGWTKVVITDSGRRFTDEMDRNYPAGDRPARDWRHLLDHRLETVYRSPSPSTNRAQVRGKPDAPGARPISGGKRW